MKAILLMLFVLSVTNSYAYNEQDIDLSNHSNQHGVIFQALDKKQYYKNIEYTTLKTGKCIADDYKKIKKIAQQLKQKEQAFWVYKYCNSSEYIYDTQNIIEVYNAYRFDLNERLQNMKEYKVIDNIVSYLPINIQIGSNYLYYLGMRNNIIEWKKDNNQLNITLPIMFSGIITQITLEDNKIKVYEIFTYDRPDNMPKNNGYIDLYIK